MSIEKVREHFKTLGIADRIMEFDVSSATVELAAVAEDLRATTAYFRPFLGISRNFPCCVGCLSFTVCVSNGCRLSEHSRLSSFFIPGVG